MYIKRIVNRIKQLGQQNARLSAIGLNPIKRAYLKNTPNSPRKYQLFRKDLEYINGYDLLHSLKEIFAEEVYKISLKEPVTIIDCGANIGLSVLYFKKQHPTARIIAFEPDNENYSLISKNIATYKLKDIVLRKEAVWHRNETLHFRSMNSLGSMITKEKAEDTYEVKAVRLKDILTTKISLLKMDIEGAEYEVLMDIRDKLHLVENLFIEYHGKFEDEYKLLELLNVISGAGMKFYIKEAMNIYNTPFLREKTTHPYDIQLNIFCFRYNFQD